MATEGGRCKPKFLSRLWGGQHPVAGGSVATSISKPPVGRATRADEDEEGPWISKPPVGRATITESLLTLFGISKPPVGRATALSSIVRLVDLSKPPVGRATI